MTPLARLWRGLAAFEWRGVVARRSRRMRHVLGAIEQGVLMVGHHDTVEVWNQSFLDMLGLQKECMRAGMTLRQLVAHSVAVGNHGAQSVDQVVAKMAVRTLRDQLEASEWSLPDGRVLHTRWVRCAEGGWIATFTDVSEHHRSMARIAHIVGHDQLTGLASRAGFQEALQRAAARARRGEEFAVLTIDLDRFKTVNDSLGLAAGDALLREVANRLRETVREVDTVARFSGDAFAILQTGVAQPDGAAALARRLLETISRACDIEGKPAMVGASIGIALATADSSDVGALMRNADLALRRAKEDGIAQPGGPGHYRFFAPDMDARAQQRRRLELDLRQALLHGEFELFYQPLIDIRDRRVSGFEALLRWRHPLHGLVSPDAFIPLAEETGLIVPVGEWVLQTACAEAMRWDTEPGHAPIRVAVNLSAVQFGVHDLAETVRAALAKSGLAPSRLELEITERMLLEDSEANIETLHRLRALGVRISMDDFGTGYSSLNYLRSFPFDKIKIDKSFIKEITSSVEAGAIVRAIAGLGASLGIATTAEGVETSAQLDQVVAEGCTEVQGYFFSPPRPACDVPALILAAPARQAA